MSALTDLDRMRHMLEYAEDALAISEGKTRADLEHDRTFNFAIQHAIFVIGEAATHVSPATREKYPAIPWIPITRMRNWLAHGYVSVNPDILWQTLQESLPELIEALLTFIPPEHS